MTTMNIDIQGLPQSEELHQQNDSFRPSQFQILAYLLIPNPYL